MLKVVLLCTINLCLRSMCLLHVLAIMYVNNGLMTGFHHTYATQAHVFANVTTTKQQ